MQKRLFALTISLYLIMLVYAFSVTAVGPLIPEFARIYGISLASSGALTFAQGIGGATSLSVGLLVAHKFTSAALIKFILAIYCLSLLALMWMPSFFYTAILFFIVGASTKMIDAVLNAYISDLHTVNRAPYLSLLHAFFGVGALVSPIIITGMLQSGFSLSIIFALLGGICILILIFYCAAQRTYPVPSRITGTNFLKNLALLKNKNMLLLSLSAMSYMIFSCGCSAWLPSYMSFVLGSTPVAANFPVYALWIGIISGRIFYSFLSKKYDHRNLIIRSNAVGGVFLLAADALNSPLFFIIAYFVSGFLCGAVVPLAISIANAEFPGRSSVISSIIMLLGTLGLMVVLPLIGFLANHLFRAGILILNCLPLLIALFMLCGKVRNGSRESSDL